MRCGPSWPWVSLSAWDVPAWSWPVIKRQRPSGERRRPRQCAATPAAMPATKRTIRFICAFPRAAASLGRARVLDRSKRGKPHRQQRRAQSAVRAGSGAGWFEGRSEIGRVGDEARGQPVEAGHIFNSDRRRRRGHDDDMRHAMVAVRNMGIARRLSGIAVGCGDRHGQRSVVDVQAPAMGRREYQHQREQQGERAAPAARARRLRIEACCEAG